MTPAQMAVIRADIDATPELSAFPNNSDGAIDICKLYNAPSDPVFNVWSTRAPVSSVYDAINWSNYTPTDAADDTVLYTNRLLAIQTKQMNLQSMLQGRETIDASKANVRAGLRDAVIALPSGAGGTSVSAGGSSGATVMNALLRNATRLEALLSTSQATTGTVTANLLDFEGSVSYPLIDEVRV
jgi:hypothetical protein